MNTSDVGSRWKDLVESLPEEVRWDLSRIDPSDPAGFTQKIKEKSSMKFWADKAYSYFSNALERIFPSFVSIVSMILLMSVGKSTSETLGKSGVSEAFYMLVKLAASLVIFRTMSLIIGISSEYLSVVCSIMNLMTPVMEAAYLIGGSITELSVSTQGIMLFVTVIGNINTYLLAPLVNVLFTLSAVSMVCSEIKLEGLVSGIRKLLMRIWQVGAIFFTFMLGTQSLIAKSVDSLGARTAKFAIGSFIPVVGGMISDAFQTLRAGLSFVRGAAGVGGIVVIALVTLSGLAPAIVYKLIVSAGEFTSEMLGLKDMSDLMKEVKGIADLVIAVCLYTSVIFILALIIFAKSWTV